MPVGPRLLDHMDQCSGIWQRLAFGVARLSTLDAVSDLTQLAESIRKFNADRDWDKFHDPKSLLLALVGEVGELAELLQWLPAG